MKTSTTIRAYLEYLQQVIKARLTQYFTTGASLEIDSIKVPNNDEDNSPLSFFFRENQLSTSEIIMLLIAFAPHVDPVFFDELIHKHLPAQSDFPQFGGVRGKNHRGFLPTAETVLFVLAGNDLEKRFEYLFLFEADHLFTTKTVISVEEAFSGEPQFSGKLIMSSEFIELFITGKIAHPKFTLNFPAKKIATEMNREDVVLNNQTSKQVEDIIIWLQHHHLLFEDENLKRKIKPGYRVLFYGPSGTGKTLTAAVLGKTFQKEVFRIDLSQVVSKYIGETEKNLESVFRRAESKDWILFFDEADALFGKRTNVQSSNDKYANQEVSYLLQRVEDYPGLLILASNFKNNLDEAFIRRFHALIHFPMPNAAERFILWQCSMPSNLPADPALSLKEIATKYELSGAAILNAIQYATLQCYASGSKMITRESILDGIRTEFMKEEKTML